MAGWDRWVLGRPVSRRSNVPGAMPAAFTRAVSFAGCPRTSLASTRLAAAIFRSVQFPLASERNVAGMTSNIAGTEVNSRPLVDDGRVVAAAPAAVESGAVSPVATGRGPVWALGGAEWG